MLTLLSQFSMLACNISLFKLNRIQAVENALSCTGKCVKYTIANNKQISIITSTVLTITISKCLNNLDRLKIDLVMGLN